MENSLYRQYDKYSSIYVKQMLPRAEHWIRQIFNKAWGKNGVECNKLSAVDEIKLNKAILTFEKILVENATEDNKIKNNCDEDIDLKSGLKANLNEYFDKENYSSALIIIKEYREKNPYYYYVLSKFYSKDFAELQEDAIVTKKDLLAFKKIILELKKEIEKSKKNVVNKVQLEKDFQNYFSKDKFTLVLKIVREYREKNPYYYYVLSKLYSKDFNQLQDDIIITDKDLLGFKSALLDIRKKLEIEFNKTNDDKEINLKKEIKSEIKNKKQRKVVQKQETIQIESLTEYFKTTDENISEAVEYLPPTERQCIKLYFGIGMRRFSLKEMENILNKSEEDIRYYIKSSILKMSNNIRIIKDRDNKEKATAKIKVRPKAYKKQEK